MKSPETHTPSPSTPETTPEDHEHFDVRNFDEIREEQRKILEAELDKVKDPYDTEAKKAARKAAYDKFEEHAREYLIDKGALTSEDDPATFAKGVAYVRYHSIDNMSEDDWLYPKVGDDGELQPSGRRLVIADYAKKSSEATPIDPEDGKDKDPTEPTPEEAKKDEEPTEPEPKPEEVKKEEEPPAPKTFEEISAIVDKDPAIIAARANVNNLRSELAALSAKRQGRLFNRKSGNLQEEYDAKRAAYETALNELIKLELSAERTAGLERDEEQERVEVAFRLIDQFKKLQTESVEHLMNTKVGGFVKWMTTGGTFKKILKGVAVGAGVGVVGAAITAFTLGTGLGALGAGVATGAAMAGRFARGFAMADNRGGRGMDVVDSEGRDSAFSKELITKTGKDKDTSQTVDAAHRILMEKFEADTKKEQGKRKKSTAIALGSIALGSVLAYGVNEIADHHYGHIKGMYDSVHSGDAEFKPGPANVIEHPTKTVIPERMFGIDAMRIDPGEGWYQTFMDLNVPQKDWPALLDRVGPQLQGVKVDGMDLAYRMPNGEWGIRMTPDGMMPKEALTIIANGHDQMTGISTAPAPIEVPASAPATPNIPVAQPEVPAGAPSAEVISAADKGSIANVLKMDVIRPSDISGPAFDKITHVASWYEPEWIAQKLELPASDWRRLEDFIAGQVKGSNALYSEVFNVDARGYLHFNNVSEIPDTTMADMLNQAKRLSSTI